MHLTVLCVKIPPPSPISKEMSSSQPPWSQPTRAPNHRGFGRQLPEVQCEGDPTCFGDEKRLERQWIGRGPHQLGQHNEPNLAQNLDWSQKNVNFGLFFLLENRSCGDMKRMEQKNKPTAFEMTVLATHFQPHCGLQPRSVMGAMRSRRFGLKGMESAESSF